MPSKDPAIRFEDIIENITRIEQYTAGMDLDTFARDTKTADAVERCLARISEAAVKLGVDAESLCPSLPWRDIRGLGNRLRHEYMNIDATRLWLIVVKDLQALRAGCERAIKRLRDNP